MFLHITNARYLEDYKVAVSFDNGREGVADLADALKGPMFEPLRNKSEFPALIVDKELKTITWPSGADMAPEYISSSLPNLRGATNSGCIIYSRAL